MTATDRTTDTRTTDQHLLVGMERAVRDAGARLRDRFDPTARPGDAAGIWSALAANDRVSLAVLQPALAALRPTARWVDDELESAPPPDGEHWIVDPVEGNINHIHGLPDWCVSATLVRDGNAVLTAVAFPVSGRVYTARAGGGAFVDGGTLSASTKSDLAAGFVGTAQASPGEPAETLTRISASIDVMLRRALLVRLAVPATVGLVTVAEGSTDVFWQHSPVISGLAAGTLLVQEAGGVVTDTAGAPWRPGSSDVVAAAPALHADALDALASVR